jgi:acetyltransferase-like isoleucine patch superfamily enzyme
VFIGPRVCLTNDKRPRALTPDGRPKGIDDWQVGRITIRHGATIGCGAIVLPDVEIGRFAMVAAGAVVSKDVPAHGLIVGVPGKLVGFACVCGKRLPGVEPTPEVACSGCARRYRIVSGARGPACQPVT